MVDIQNSWSFDDKLETYRIHLPTMRGCYVTAKNGHFFTIQFDDGPQESIVAHVLTLRKEEQIQW